ncbi:hypothetical protein VNO77_27559 [Canavalia gladiata]
MVRQLRPDVAEEDQAFPSLRNHSPKTPIDVKSHESFVRGALEKEEPSTDVLMVRKGKGVYCECLRLRFGFFVLDVLMVRKGKGVYCECLRL